MMPVSDENACPHVHRSNRDKAMLVGAVQSGKTIPEAAKLFHFPRTTAYEIYNRFKKTGSVSDRPPAGRPPKLNDRAQRHLVRLSRQNRRKPLADVGNMLILRVPKTTVRRYLEVNGYGRYRAQKVPYLTTDHRKARRLFGRMYRRCGRGFWKRVISSDECYVYLGDKKGTVYVTRRRDEVYEEDYLVPTFQQSSIRVMVWGCVGLGWKRPLVVLDYPGGRGGGMTAARYQEQVLEKVLEEVYADVEHCNGSAYFQQDGAASHRAKSTQKWLHDRDIHLLFHPASSPDLNAIECVWHELKRRIRLRTRMPTSLEELKATIHEAWAEIPQDFIDRQICSMPDCVQAVLHAKGGHTKY